MLSPEIGVLLIALVAVVAPLISELPLGFRLPAVVVEIVLGVVVGPHVPGLIAPGDVLAFLGRIGLAFPLF